MTKDEILDMKPGRELDALVAEKVMGFGLYEDKIVVGGYNHDGEVDVELYPCPHYSTDISAAWEIIEKWTKPYGTFELNMASIAGDICWTAKFGNYAQVISITAPDAICKAALLAKLEAEAI